MPQNETKWDSSLRRRRRWRFPFCLETRRSFHFFFSFSEDGDDVENEKQEEAGAIDPRRRKVVGVVRKPGPLCHNLRLDIVTSPLFRAARNTRPWWVSILIEFDAATARSQFRTRFHAHMSPEYRPKLNARVDRWTLKAADGWILQVRIKFEINQCQIRGWSEKFFRPQHEDSKQHS